MTRWDDTTSKRQTIYNGVLDFDHFAQTHLETAVMATQPKSQSRSVLLYFIVMCNEMLKEESIDKSVRLSYLRMALTFYHKGQELVRAENEPEFWKQQDRTSKSRSNAVFSFYTSNCCSSSCDLFAHLLCCSFAFVLIAATVVHRLIEPIHSKPLRPVLVRLMTRCAAINHFLATGDAQYYTQRAVHYKHHVVDLIGKIPTDSSMIQQTDEAFEQLFSKGTSHLRSYQLNTMNASMFVSMLTESQDLKTISEIDLRLMRHKLKFEPSNAKDYCFFTLQNQVAIVVQSWLHKMALLLWPSTEDRKQSWIVDLHLSRDECIHTAVAAPQQLVRFCRAQIDARQMFDKKQWSDSTAATSNTLVSIAGDTELGSIHSMLCFLSVWESGKPLTTTAHAETTLLLIAWLQSKCCHDKKKTNLSMLDSFWSLAAFVRTWCTLVNGSFQISIRDRQRLRQNAKGDMLRAHDEYCIKRQMGYVYR